MAFELEELRKQPRVADHCIMELALDETELTLRVGGLRCQTAHVLTVHARLHWSRAGAKEQANIVLPPVMLESTQAECLLAAVAKRLPLPLAGFRDMCCRFILVVNTDSGTSGIKLANHLQTLFPCIAAPCRMHQGCLTMLAMFNITGRMSALFCASLLLRRQRLQATLRKKLRDHVRAKLKITYDPPSPADQAYVAALFDLLHHLLTWRLQSKGPGDATGTARLAAWGRLRDFFSGPFDGDRIYHYCPYGCHASREHAAESLVQDLTALMIDHPPVVPSANKWSKLLPPVLWFGVFTAWSSLLPALARCLQEPYGPYGEMPVFDEDALLGLDTRKAWQQ
jgi:hypothetical protein